MSEATIDQTLSSPPKTGEEAIDRKLSLREHILELRRRLIYSVLAVVVTTGVAFVFIDPIFKVLIRPVGGVQLVFTQMTEMLMVYFTLALTIGVAAALPFILLQAVKFVAPALYPRERVFLYAMLPAALIAFAGGAIFAYFVLLPPAFRFLLGFGSDIATPLISINNYVSLVTRLLFWIGVVFETPVVIFILAKIGIVNAGMLARKWRLAMLLSFIAAAIITPTPDPVNQSMVAVPLVCLYGVSILLAHIAQLGKKRKAPAPP